MDEPGQGHLGRSKPASGRIGSLDDPDREAGPSEGDRGGKPVRSGADDDGVEPIGHA